MSLLRATRSHVLLIIAGVFAATPFGPDAGAMQAHDDGGGVYRTADGALRLNDDAGPAPAAIGAFERFGIWDSPPAQVAGGFETIKVGYRSHLPAGTERFVALRASQDGHRWSEWEWDVADGATVTFASRQHWVQHRVVLLGADGQTPVVSAITIQPRSSIQARRERASQAEGVAPTYRLRVSRQGMVGGRTANGHRITRNDMFVSLPSWTALSSRNGSEYLVRLSANGKSIVVPVMDVGPWNRHDNFWDVDRERYKDLPVGWPQDHAAYYENHNRRRAEKGFVRFPTAVDVGDGAYWALGLRGAQATVDVTFLWLGNDPGPDPQPLNTSPSQRPEPRAP